MEPQEKNEKLGVILSVALLLSFVFLIYCRASGINNQSSTAYISILAVVAISILLGIVSSYYGLAEVVFIFLVCFGGALAYIFFGPSDPNCGVTHVSSTGKIFYPSCSSSSQLWLRFFVAWLCYLTGTVIGFFLTPKDRRN